MIKLFSHDNKKVCAAGAPRSPGRCFRRTVWQVTSISDSSRNRLCDYHFDLFMEEHWDAFDQWEIERLSDNEKDFDTREPYCRVPKSIPSPTGV